MSHIRVLDCTLRDGGYCNEWNFGEKNIQKIVAGLAAAGVNIIECGFLTNKVIYSPDVSKYSDIDQLQKIIPPQITHGEQDYVVMMNYGEYDVSNLPACEDSYLDGIRVAFHKKDLIPALETCRALKAKGYKVFIQAMVSLSYTDEEFLDLIRRVNQLDPYAFYIVDSFGMMKKKNLLRMFYMVEHNLADNIIIGFHSHNNMQLAYSNAQCLIETLTNRSLIIDASVFGMGRGAGNLNTELLVEYLNENIGTQYSLKPLLNIIDEILNGFYEKNRWGYSLPNYLSAAHDAHPNYAGYLSAKNTLTVEAMDEIFSMMLPEKKCEYDKAYIEELYLKYMERGAIHEEHLSAIKETLHGKTILLIAPGKSSVDEQDKIAAFLKGNDTIAISVNYKYPYADIAWIFASNMRRFKQIPEDALNRCIATSNIASEHPYLTVSYFSLLNTVESVRDNAGLMAIRFLIDMGCSHIMLAGFDGYGDYSEENYAISDMAYSTGKTLAGKMNQGMCAVIQMYRKLANIDFLTEEKYIH